MSQKQSEDETTKIYYEPRTSGKTIKQLMEFYTASRAGKRIVFATPEGNIYSPAALKARDVHRDKLIEARARLDEQQRTVAYHTEDGDVTFYPKDLYDENGVGQNVRIAELEAEIKRLENEG